MRGQVGGKRVTPRAVTRPATTSITTNIIISASQELSYSFLSFISFEQHSFDSLFLFIQHIIAKENNRHGRR